MPNITPTIKVYVVFLAALFLSCGDPTIPGDDDSQGGDTTKVIVKDTIPPNPATGLSLELNETMSTITLSWTAPFDDSVTEPVDLYDIRYSHSRWPIEDWGSAFPVHFSPTPAKPGVTQSYDFTHFFRGKDFYTAIKSIDEDGNRSEMSDIVSIHIPGYELKGRCFDAINGIPIEGLATAVSAGNTYRFFSNEEGIFSKDDLAVQIIYIDVETGNSQVAYHNYHRKFEFQTDTHLDIACIPFKETILGDFPTLLNLFKYLTRTSSTNPSSVLYKWKRLPVKCFIPDFINENGVDYGSAANAAANRWMERTGIELFTFVDTPPDTGIVLSFLSVDIMGKILGITHHTNGADTLPLLEEVDIRDDFPADKATLLYKIMLHELGHTIRLGHMSSPDYIMYGGQPLPEDISEDEVSVVKLWLQIPNKTEMGAYDEAPP